MSHHLQHQHSSLIGHAQSNSVTSIEPVPVSDVQARMHEIDCAIDELSATLLELRQGLHDVMRPETDVGEANGAVSGNLSSPLVGALVSQLQRIQVATQIGREIQRRLTI